MLELEPYGAEAGLKNPGAVTAHKDLQTTFTNILLIEVWKLVNVLEVHSLVATMAVWVFRASKICFRECKHRQQDYQGSKFGAVFPRLVMLDVARAVFFDVFPHVRKKCS